MGAFIVIAGGGTGGHVFPGLAIAQELRRRDPSREILFLGSTSGLETRLVPQAGFPLKTLSLGGIAGRSLPQRVVAVARACAAVLRCLAMYVKRRPAVVVGVGGFVSGPAVAAALLLRVPTMIQEQNAVPGLTNRWLGRWVDRIALSFPGPPAAFGGRGAVTGNPVRAPFFEVAPWTGPRGRLRLLIFGGSRGARSLNRAAFAALPLLADARDRLAIVHQTGEADLPEAQAAYASSGFAEARAIAFIDDMPARLESADLVVCRAGAGTVFELAAAGRASVLVPYPFAANRHQDRNAEWMARAGAAVVVPDAEMDGDRLAAIVRESLASPDALGARARAARSLARPAAAADIAALAEGIMKGARA
jgi:UDP-N-acetylglucosamine--N-acetylmuramyl-(pentapeptide) pyrophosphoryl-undecaprenol N-acetylglucosamine transferase